jgi:hypothetical protein
VGFLIALCSFSLLLFTLLNLFSSLRVAHQNFFAKKALIDTNHAGRTLRKPSVHAPAQLDIPRPD